MVDSFSRQDFQQGNAVGLCVAVIRNGETHIYNYGETARGNHTLPNENTVYEIGSISKTFTATLLALQVTRGKMKLDDPLTKYLPDSVPVPVFEGTPVTLVTLSNHTSGLPRLAPNMAAHARKDNFYADYTNDLLFQFLRNFKPIRKPGEKYEYSNIGAGLLGVLLARYAGTTYETLLEREITRPLQMKDTRVQFTPAMKSRLAQGYKANGEMQIPWDFQEIAGLGGIRSTMHDMLIYARANMSRSAGILEKAITLTHQPTYTRPNTDNATVALGWHIYTWQSHSGVVHNGQTGGYHSFMAVDPEAGIAIIVLSNVATENRVGLKLLRGL